MASRLYYPTLVRILHHVCTFIARYNTQLTKVLRERFGEEAVIALQAVDTACHAFTELVEIEIKP